MTMGCANRKVVGFRSKLFYNKVWYENGACQ